MIDPIDNWNKNISFLSAKIFVKELVELIKNNVIFLKYSFYNLGHILVKIYKNKYFICHGFFCQTLKMC